MTKKQVIALSAVLCAFGLALGVTLVMSAFGNAGNYSLIAWVVFTLLGVSCLGLVASPGLVFAWYPAEGFSGVPAPETDTSSDDDDEDEFSDDEEADDDEELSHEDDGEQLFDDDAMEDDFDDDLGDFEDDDK